MAVSRRKFQGVLNILSFNRHFYVFGILALLLIIISRYLFNWPDFLFWTIVIGFIYGLIIPLVISAYVYDFSGFYNFEWLKQMKLPDQKDSFNLNINAGFDETSYSIAEILPNSQLQVYDFYDANRHTEPAIVRARKVTTEHASNQSINTDFIPLENHSVDHVFLISAAHEIRSHQEKVQFLKECRRVCKENGQVIMVEHLRDLPNFIAFTIGFTHFFSKSTWESAISEAGFQNLEEQKFTPFMSIFQFSS